MTVGFGNSQKGILLGGTETIQYVNTVSQGALLYIVVAGHGFGTPPQAGLVTSVSDDVNGAWTLDHNSGNQVDSGTHNYSGAAYYFANSRANPPGGIRITVTSTVGQSPASYLVLTIPGAATGRPIAFETFNDALASDGSGNVVTPQTSPVYDGGTVVTWVAGYSGGAIPNTGLTLSTPSFRLLGSQAGSDATIAVAQTVVSPFAGTQPNATFGGFFSSVSSLVGGTIFVLDNSVTNLYLNPVNRAVVAAFRDGQTPFIDVTGLLVMSVPTSLWVGVIQPAVTDAFNRFFDIAVADDFSFGDVTHILTQAETDVQTMSTYQGIGTPTLVDTVGAVDALIRTPGGVNAARLWATGQTRNWADAAGRFRMGRVFWMDAPGRVRLAIPSPGTTDAHGRVDLAIPTDAWADAAGRVSFVVPNNAWADAAGRCSLI